MILERLLIVSHDVVGKRMAGPGIRYHHLSRILSRSLDVILAAPEGASSLDGHPYKLLEYRDPYDKGLVSAIQRATIVLVPAIWINHIAGYSSSVRVVIDGYDPFVAETLALGYGNVDAMVRTLTRAVLKGDFFICASERQRDWWLGLLEANGRVNAHTFADDASLRRLIDVVPYGLPERVPQRTKNVVKGVWSGIELDDKVILWGGGLWPWLDPLTAVQAMAEVWQQRQDVRLIFPGTKHPNPGMRGIPTHVNAARELAQKRGLLGKAVFFGGWVPYEDWPNVLLESDLALTLHYDTLETRLAFRSRVLGYIWAGLPIVATRGDATSALISTHSLGAVVDYESVADVATAILRLLEVPKGRYFEQFEHIRQALTWEKAVQPLLNFCQHPYSAPDKAGLGDDLGNPFYVKRQQQLTAELEDLRDLVQRYEQGRFMRLMRWLHRIYRRIQGSD